MASFVLLLLVALSCGQGVSAVQFEWSEAFLQAVRNAYQLKSLTVDPEDQGDRTRFTNNEEEKELSMHEELAALKTQVETQRQVSANQSQVISDLLILTWRQTEEIRLLRLAEQERLRTFDDGRIKSEIQPSLTVCDGDITAMHCESDVARIRILVASAGRYTGLCTNGCCQSSVFDCVEDLQTLNRSIWEDLNLECNGQRNCSYVFELDDVSMRSCEPAGSAHYIDIVYSCETTAPAVPCDEDAEVRCVKGDKGAAGVPGLPGLSGLDGAPGPIGPPGRDGLPGRMGADGFPGLPGIKGDSGMCDLCKGRGGRPGLPGIPGQKGERGFDGLPGIDGRAGLPGFDGIKGDAGEPGVPGLPGQKGDAGAPGRSGLNGLPGIMGEKGERGRPGRPGMNGLPGMKGEPGN